MFCFPFLGNLAINPFSVCLIRFTPVAYRQGMKRSIAEKYIDIFNWYEADLEEVKNIYEKFKVGTDFMSLFLYFVSNISSKKK